MIGQIGSFEDIGERGQSAVRSTVKSAKQSAQNFAKATATQITGSQSSAPQNDQWTNEASSTASQKQMSDADAKKFLQDLYGVSNKSTSQSTNQNSTNNPSQKPPAPTPKQTIKTALGIPESAAPQETAPTVKQTVKNAMGIPEISSNEKTPEELAKIEALRQQLHKDYYESLTNRKKPIEEHVTEKLEREEKEQKMSELEVQKKKPPKLPMTQKQGTGENVVGVWG